MRIQKLPTLLANQIAAGEVVERPASVIKELIDNAVHAGATQIDITVEASGLGMLQVADNGSGIAKEQIPLALERHVVIEVSTRIGCVLLCSLSLRHQRRSHVNPGHCLPTELLHAARDEDVLTSPR